MLKGNERNSIWRARACVFMAVRKATRGRGNFINGGEVRRCVCV